MKTTILTMVAAVTLLASCGEAALTPETASEKWCELNKAAKDAEKGDAKDKARDAVKSFEKEVETLYKDNEDAMKTIKKLTKECD